MAITKLSKTITFRVSRKMDQKLQKYSKKMQLPQSLIIRRWLAEKLKNIR